MLFQYLKTINYTSVKIWGCSFFLFSFLGSEPIKQPSWGFKGHKTINFMAIYTLPPEMFGFYKENQTF